MTIDIISKVRYLLNENVVTNRDIFTYETKSVFKLADENTIDVSTVYRNDVLIAESGNGWSYSPTTNRITFLGIPTLVYGDILEVVSTAYPNYSDIEITNYINSALIYLSVNHYYDFIMESADAIYPTPTASEANLIAMVTAILIKPDNKTYRLPDITINSPSDIPTDQKIHRAIAIFKKDCHGVVDITSDVEDEA